MNIFQIMCNNLCVVYPGVPFGYLVFELAEMIWSHTVYQFRPVIFNWGSASICQGFCGSSV